MWRYGRDFYTAACIVKKTSTTHVSMPFFFLAYQSIELSLKAFLLKKGKTVNELKGRNYGHRIDKILEVAIAQGLTTYVTLQKEHIDHLKIGSPIYLDRRFQYIETGSMTVPDIEPIDNAARLLTESLETFCCFPRVQQIEQTL